MSGEDFRDGANGEIEPFVAGADFKEVMAPVKTCSGIILRIDKQNRCRGAGRGAWHRKRENRPAQDNTYNSRNCAARRLTCIAPTDPADRFAVVAVARSAGRAFALLINA